MEEAYCSLKMRRQKMEEEKKKFGNISTSEKVNEINSNGAFVRQNNRFTTPFGTKEGDLKVEANRYRLIWTPLCPWATRQMITIKLLGLDKVISVGTVNPIRTDKGWEFSLDENGVDPVLGIRYLAEIYASTDPEYNGRATVPALVDVIEKKVVNNDYHHLSNYFEVEWKEFHKDNAPDLYPVELRDEIDKLNEILFNEINNGVYKTGFATSQEEYEKNFNLVFNRLDYFEELLGKKRFLFGDYITDSDIRLYVTLARFDTAYYFVFRTNKKRIRDYNNLWNYAKELYSIKAFKESTDFLAIKKGYLLGDIAENPFKILPLGPDNNVWNEPNNRSELFGPLKFNYER